MTSNCCGASPRRMAAAVLSHEERLQLQQLRLLAWADQRSGAKDEDAPDEPRAHAAGYDPQGAWALTEGVELRPWQTAAADAWFEAGRRGTVKVVTGAGKTVVAMAIAERL